MSEVLEPNRPALAILAIAGILIGMSIAAVLVIPGFQPRLVQVSSVGGGGSSSSGGSSSPAIAGSNSYGYCTHQFRSCQD